MTPIRAGVILAIVQASLLGQAAKEPWKLGGVFQLGYTDSEARARFLATNSSRTGSNELFWGLDFAARGYILDPRFITITLEPSVLRSSGAENGSEHHGQTVGGSAYLEFLPESSYPFRFHFIDENIDYVQSHLTSANTAYRSIGFDWTLRKPHLPRVYVMYDSNAADYELSSAPVSATHAKTLTVLASGKAEGWDSNFAYTRESTVEAFTGFATAADLLQADTKKDIWSHSTLLVRGAYQIFRFPGAAPGARLDLPLLESQADLSTRHTSRLTSRVFYNSSWIGNLAAGLQTQTAPGAGTPPVLPAPHGGSASFQTIGAGLDYQVVRGLTAGESSSVSFISSAMPGLESPARTVNAEGHLTWSRSVGFLQTLAGYQRGRVWVSTNFGNGRAIWHDSYNLGLGVGSVRRVLVRGDYVASRRPELFQIGGRSSETALTGSLESRALRRWYLRASAGRQVADILTSLGRQRFHVTSYSASVSRRWVSVSASRGVNDTLQNLLFAPLVLNPGQLFQVLPVELLQTAPFSATYSITTTGAVLLKVRSSLDAQFRYFRERILFPAVPGVLIKQYEGYVDYRLGKFTISAGVLINAEDTLDIAQRNRRYYFVRLARPFKIV